MFGHHCFSPSPFLKGYDIFRKFLALGVICHIEETETHLPHTGIGSHEVAAFNNTLNQLVRKRFVRLVMEGERAKELFLNREVFHELRRQFNKIPPNVGTAKALKSCVGKHSMQRMPKLVEEGFHLT